MTTSLLSKVSCVHPVRQVDNPAGTLVYFHPGGLPSQVMRDMTRSLTDWRLLSVELMLCIDYVEATNKQGKLTTTIEKIAAGLIPQLPAKESNLLFVGWSFGGVVAFEVASRWQGKEVPKLVFIDSIAPVTTLAFSEDNVAATITFKWFVQYLQSLKRCQIRLDLPWFWRRDGDEILQDILNQAKEQGAFDPDTKLVAFKKVFTTFTQGLMRNAQLGSDYQPIPYDGRLLLIRAKNGLLRRFSWTQHMGWKPLVSHLSVKSVNFNHYQIISKQAAIETLGKLISEYVGQCQWQPKTEGDEG